MSSAILEAESSKLTLINQQTLPNDEGRVDLILFVIHGIGYSDEDESTYKIHLTNSMKAGLLSQYWDQPPINFEIIVIKWKEAVSEFVGIQHRLHTSNNEMRKITHNYAGDVIFYMTPHIADQINNVVCAKVWAALETIRFDPRTRDARIGVFAHSLGSVIAFDVFTHNQIRVGLPENSKTEPLIPYGTIDALFLLGSPLGGFLSLHNGSPQMMNSFTLPPFPCLNIYHPEDPVAFRLEPLFRRELFDKLIFPSPVPVPNINEKTRKNAIERYFARLASQIASRGNVGVGLKASIFGIRGALENASQKLLGLSPASGRTAAISALQGSSNLPEAVLFAAADEDDYAHSNPSNNVDAAGPNGSSLSKRPSMGSRFFGRLLESAASKISDMETRERTRENSDLSSLQVEVDRQAMYGWDSTFDGEAYLFGGSGGHYRASSSAFDPYWQSNANPRLTPREQISVQYQPSIAQKSSVSHFDVMGGGSRESGSSVTGSSVCADGDLECNSLHPPPPHQSKSLRAMGSESMHDDTADCNNNNHFPISSRSTPHIPPVCPKSMLNNSSPHQHNNTNASHTVVKVSAHHQPLIANGWGGRLDFAIEDRSITTSLLPQVQAMYAHTSYLSNSDVALLALNVLKPLKKSPTEQHNHFHDLPWSYAVGGIQEHKKKEQSLLAANKQ